MSKDEPWPGYNKWKSDSDRYHREAKRSTAAFGVFCFVFCAFVSLVMISMLWGSVARDEAGALPVAIIGTVILAIGVYAAGYGFDVFKYEDEKDD